MSSPRVTVIIPTYNWSSVLPYSIGSVLWQTFTDYELLVIGDGCTDDSEAVVGAIDDPRVRWINLPSNTGHQSGPNNEGVRQARGDLIAYLGHDDLWLPHHLPMLVSAIDDGAGFAYGITERVGANGDRVAVPGILGPYHPGLWIPPTGVVHRRSAILAVGGWRESSEARMSREKALWARMWGAGIPFVFVPRLTAVKFPASRRRDVYRLRPCHEQAAWSARMRTEPDFEATEVTRILVEAKAISFRALVKREVLRVPGRLWRRLRGFGGRGFDRTRKLKGLGPLP